MWSDPIADALTRIRNGVMIRAKQVRLRRSRIVADICRVLRDEGYIQGYDLIDDANQGEIRVQLKYGPRGEPPLVSLQRRSKTGCRVYVGSDELPRIRNGMGISIVSTNRGVMSDRDCRRMKVGGELLCTVY